MARAPAGRMRQVRHGRGARGVTLIELVIFIVLVGIAFAAFLSIYNALVVRSADPLLRKQALAIAESLLEEVQLMPFTFCDPNDANALTAASPAGCASMSEDTIGPEGGETRFGASPFDNVNDYHMTSATTGVSDIEGNAVGGLGSYVWQVQVFQEALGTISAASKDALRIRVTVNAPDGSTTVTLDGYRARYAPNTLP